MTGAVNKDEMKEMANKPNYMTVPAVIREPDKIEMSRQLDGVYRFDHAMRQWCLPPLNFYKNLFFY